MNKKVFTGQLPTQTVSDQLVLTPYPTHRATDLGTIFWYIMKMSHKFIT